MTSETNVRHEGNEFVPITNLIMHHSIANILNQATKFIRIFDIVKKALPLLLF
jgi:hypothetical protein